MSEVDSTPTTDLSESLSDAGPGPQAVAEFSAGASKARIIAVAGALDGNGITCLVVDSAAQAREAVRTILPVGAEVSDVGVHFRVWAPIRESVEVVFDDGHSIPLQAEASGYFSGLAPNARVGSRYKYKLDGGETCPDPASRFQPDGPHGSSMVVDPADFRWTDRDWRGVALPHQVIYEMHIGTFTKPGTWRSAEDELPHLAETGVTVLEVMPVAEFPGRFGWGYDGVQWFAPAHIYGSPDDFRRFVDRAHSLGLGVILDVVYNHLGPDGNYVEKFAPQFFCEKTTDWGKAINFDGDDCGPVREFCIANACS